MYSSWSWLRECQECAKLSSRQSMATLNNLKYKIHFDLFNTFLVTTWFHMCYFIVLMSSLLFYNLENSKIKNNTWMSSWVQTCDWYCIYIYIYLYIIIIYIYLLYYFDIDYCTSLCMWQYKCISLPLISLCRVFGHISYRSDWELVKVDFRQSFPRQCTEADYDSWKLTDLKVPNTHTHIPMSL